MASPEERQIARLAGNPDFEALKQFLAREEDEAVQALARKSFALPEEHDTVEWQKLRAYWDGARSVIKTAEAAHRAVQKAESQPQR